VLDRFDADFASDARNVHFGLVIDGFDPFNTNSALYYCWPVFVVPYTNYYGIINEILEFSFTGKKELKVVFFDCDWFDSNNGTCQNQFSMVKVKHNERLLGYDTFILAHQVKQVYYLSYPCQKLNAWWVVHKVNPHEWLHTPDDVGYHDTPTLDDDVDEVYQEEELPPSLVIYPGAGLNDLM
jgi:hypothetical protein